MPPSERSLHRSQAPGAVHRADGLRTCISVPDGPQWTYEIKFDGYRAVAVSADGKLSVLSRNQKSFNKQFAGVATDLKTLPSGCVLDGEIVVDESGPPKFNLLQNYGEQPRVFITSYSIGWSGAGSEA
jgi:ATP-dependent DNA ligase